MFYNIFDFANVMMERITTIPRRFGPMSIARCTAGSKNRWQTWIGVMIIFFVFGCNGEKSSLYGDLDHVLPDHWPGDVTQAGQMIKQRLEKVKSSGGNSQQTNAELLDLISWAPEIAADTELAEVHWQPIYDQSEKLQRRLSAEESPQAIAAEIEKLSELLLLAPSQFKSDPMWTNIPSAAASADLPNESPSEIPQQNNQPNEDAADAATGKE
ncbi:MAG TPA: hypothetical protein DCF63_00010 [Planctomycetaceae bacterium]|nr:hypothetical protein [Planctomycetaceae bacterium]